MQPSHPREIQTAAGGIDELSSEQIYALYRILVIYMLMLLMKLMIRIYLLTEII